MVAIQRGPSIRCRNGTNCLGCLTPGTSNFKAEGWLQGQSPTRLLYCIHAIISGTLAPLVVRVVLAVTCVR